MDSIRRWSTLICITAAICILVELLIPPGKMTKTINMVIGLFIISSVTVTFFQNCRKINFNIRSLFDMSKPNLDSKFTENINCQISELANKNIKSIIKSKLNRIGVSPKKIEIFMDTNEDNCIIMIKSKIYLEKRDESFKTQIQNEMLRDLNVQIEFIDV